MRSHPAILFAFASLIVSGPSPGQQATTAGRARTLLQQAHAAVSGSSTLNDISISATAHRIAGSDDETGTALLRALATGEARVDSDFPSGKYTEVIAKSDKGPLGQWSGPDGVVHRLPHHNLLVDSSWFFPAMMLRKMIFSPGLVMEDLGTEVRDEHRVEHLIVTRQFPEVHLPEHAVQLLEHASQIAVYLDSSTLLPSAVTFNTHPDEDASRDIPVEIRFLDYRVVDGVKVPFHVMKFLNNGLVLDLQLETVSLNAGLSTNDFRAE